MGAETTEARRFRPRLHAFPFLAALVTVSALVAANPQEGIRLTNLVIPTSLALLAACIGWAVGGLCVRDPARQGLVAMIVTLPLLTSGYLFGWVRNTAENPSAGDPWELGLVVVTIVIGVVIVRRIPEPEQGLVRFLNLTTLIMLLLAAPALWGVASADDVVAIDGSAATVPDGPKPDVYLVVLDAYSGTESLSSIYGFDNRPFLDSLRTRGFRMPESPRANYTKTFLSVGSMLNREYADRLVAASAPGYRDRLPAYRALEFNRTARELTASGYDFYYVGSSYPPMASNRLSVADSVNPPSREFEAMWIDMTAIVPLIRIKCRLIGGCARNESPFEPEDARDTEARLASLAGFVSRPGPKFVMAHLLLPHGPYRFGPSCEHRSPRWTVGSAAVNDSVARELYVEQVQCTNRKLLSLVDEIREASADPAVIILQADHGHGRFPGDMPRDLRDTSADQVRERFDVFAAYAGPGRIADSLAAQRTPVNVFRTLFRVQWGFDEPPLADRFFWSNTDRPLDLIRVAVE